MKFRSKILILAALIFAIGDLFVVFTPAKAVDLTGSFGGFIIANTPPTLICPDIITIFNFPAEVMNIYVAPASLILPFGDLVTPGTWVKGVVVPVPAYPSCPVPVYPIVFIGTS